MIQNKVLDSEIQNVKYFIGNGNLDFKMIFYLDNNKVLYFNSLWFHYFDLKDLNLKFIFKQYRLISNITIEKMHCFEGVGHFIYLSNKDIICINQEILNFENQHFRYNFKVVTAKEKDRYHEVLNDIKELGNSDDIIEGSPKFW